MKKKYKKARVAIREMIEDGTIKQATDEEIQKAVIVVMAVEDFDVKDNEAWKLRVNKSYPRDVHCSSCLRQVVMSGGTFEKYKANERKNQVICNRCISKVMGDLNEK